MGEERSSRGRLVGRYVVHDRIAAGGMATVHLGRLLGAAGFSRTVAIKRLHDQYARDPEFVAMLLDEARLAAQIRHPNVVQTVDVVAEADELLVVMDYVEGDSVAHLSKLAASAQEKIPHALSASVAAQALQGLHAAHEAKDKNGRALGIVHRDVSPQNILVGVDGVARVLDFGIAKAASRSTSTEDGQLKGKTAYMAPEQLRHGAVDRRTDVFAAAIVLWELLAGRRLFFADSPAEAMSRVLEMPIDPPHVHAPDVPLELSLIALRGLERKPEDRFQTAEEMALAIEDAVTFPRAKEIGAWVSRVASRTLEGRAALLQEVERSSHRLLAASTDPELQRAIDEAERRRATFDMPTDVGGKKEARSLPPPPPLAPGEEGTGLATVNSTVSPIIAGRSSRVALVAGVAIACVGVIALGVALVITQDARGNAPVAPVPAVVVAPLLDAGDAKPDAGASATLGSASAKPGLDLSSASGKKGQGKGTKGVATGATGAATATATATAKPKPPECDPPYDVDEKGNKHFKEQCL